MLDLLVIFKICLGLVLLTGFITGYLYTFFSSKEAHQSAITELEGNIKHNQEQSALLEKETLKLHEQMKDEENEITILDQQIQNTKHNISTHQKAVNTLQKAIQKLEEKYGSVMSMLKMQTERLKQIKEEIGTDTLSSLSQKIDEQQQAIHRIETKVEKETTSLNEIQSQHDTILIQKKEFEAEKNELHHKLTAINEELLAMETKTKTIDEELQTKIASLKQEAENWIIKIKKYKKQLLQLKNSH